MSKTYKIGVAKLVHDHVWGELDAWVKTGRVEIVAVGEPSERLRTNFSKKFPEAKLYDSWEAMLASEDLDIVQIAAENSLHAEITEAAAAKGCHVITEKPMAATLEQANRMVAACEKAGVRLLVNWPTAWIPSFQEMERVILSGEIGELRYFKYRSAHNGPKEIGCDESFWSWLYDEEKNGAGAFMDYCCYGAAMMARFLGLPEKVLGMRAVLAKDYPLPDDNAIVSAWYKGAHCVAEASWTQVTGYVNGNPYAYGSEGAIALQNGKVQLLKPGKAMETYDPPALEAPKRSGPEYLIHCIESGEAIEGTCSASVSRDAQEILEAGLRAARTETVQHLPLSLS
jgi:predicted dehydrogenase